MTAAMEQLVLLDGATGSELDRRGVDVSMPLWSARAMDDAPDILQSVHQEYLDAGADAVITNTFRTHERSLAKCGLGGHAERLTRSAVDIARAACLATKPEAMVLGGIAPLEDCYRPELAPDAENSRREHGQIIEHFLNASADLVLLETMCSSVEAGAAADVAAELSPGGWAISFCLRGQGEPGMLLDGTRLADLIDRLDAPCFIGINCVGAGRMLSEVTHLRGLLGDGLPIAAYGNVGHADEEGGWVNTDAVDPERYADHAMEWLGAGADIIGGCCGTRPGTIEAIRRRMPITRR